MQSLILAANTSTQYAAQGMRSTADGTPTSFVFWAFVVLGVLVLVGLVAAGGPRRRSIDEEWNSRR